MTDLAARRRGSTVSEVTYGPPEGMEPREGVDCKEAMRHRNVNALACLAVLSLLAGCGTSAEIAPSAGPVATSSPTATPTPSAQPPPRGCDSGFVVRSGHVTIRISEKVGPVTIHEAVLEADQVTGGFALAGTGAFEQCSTVVVDLRGLRSTDEFPGPESVKDRDEVVHKDLLETAKFPYAVLRIRAGGNVPSPVPAVGHWSFPLSGELTLHNLAREVEWQVDATRQGSALTAAATATLTFDDFRIDRPDQILGLDEKIRIAVQIQAEALP